MQRRAREFHQIVVSSAFAAMSWTSSLAKSSFEPVLARLSVDAAADIMLVAREKLEFGGGVVEVGWNEAVSGWDTRRRVLVPGRGALVISLVRGCGGTRGVLSAESALSSMLGGGVGDLDCREWGGWCRIGG